MSFLLVIAAGVFLGIAVVLAVLSMIAMLRPREDWQ